MMDKIYAVSSGDYSDYHIEAIFESEELAQKYLKEKIDELKEKYGKDHEYWNEYREIEVYILNKKKMDIGYYNVGMYKNGNVRNVYKRNGRIDADEEVMIKQFKEREEHNKQRINKIINCLIFCVSAKDEKHAIKIANERRTQLIAENKI
jgi:hypothetical protein